MPFWVTIEGAGAQLAVKAPGSSIEGRELKALIFKDAPSVGDPATFELYYFEGGVRKLLTLTQVVTPDVPPFLSPVTVTVERLAGA